MQRSTARATGELAVEAVIDTGNNAVFLAEAAHDGQSVRCVYKPVRGERPLWDFPGAALAPREVAAYLVDQAAGWGFVPPTVLRDGPLGVGSCQEWVDQSTERTLFDVFPRAELPPDWLPVAAGLSQDETGAEREVVVAHAADDRLASVVLFDAVINNSDRKAGHLLLTTADRLHAIDHGVTFHTEPKLRTVLWGWAGKPIPVTLLESLERLEAALAGPLTETLNEFLAPAEITATAARLRHLLETRSFPEPAGDWPPLPYPLF